VSAIEGLANAIEVMDSNSERNALVRNLQESLEDGSIDTNLPIPAIHNPRGSGRKPGVRQPNKRTNTIKEIWGNHKEIIRLHVMGMKSIHIAEILNITPEGISTILNSPIVVKEIARLQGKKDDEVIEVTKEFAANAKYAVRHMRKMVENVETADSVQFQICKDMLDRDGHKPVEKKEHTHTGIFTLEDITQMKKDAMETANVLDITPDHPPTNNNIQESVEYEREEQAS